MKDIIEKLLEINLEINSLLKSETMDFGGKLENLLKEKEAMICSLKSFKEKSEEEFNNLKNTQFSEAWKSIQTLEQENLTLIQEKKDKLGGEIQGIKTHSKAISSYKFKKDQEPRLFDDSC